MYLIVEQHFNLSRSSVKRGREFYLKFIQKLPSILEYKKIINTRFYNLQILQRLLLSLQSLLKPFASKIFYLSLFESSYVQNIISIEMAQFRSFKIQA